VTFHPETLERAVRRTAGVRSQTYYDLSALAAQMRAAGRDACDQFVIRWEREGYCNHCEHEFMRHEARKWADRLDGLADKAE
jgi:hypothetical protein